MTSPNISPPVNGEMLRFGTICGHSLKETPESIECYVFDWFLLVHTSETRPCILQNSLVSCAFKGSSSFSRQIEVLPKQWRKILSMMSRIVVWLLWNWLGSPDPATKWTAALITRISDTCSSNSPETSVRDSADSWQRKGVHSLVKEKKRKVRSQRPSRQKKP